MLKRVPLLLVIFLMASCGFRLRGYSDIPPWLNNIAIVAENNSHQEMPAILKKQFQAYGKNIISSPAKADYLLIIEKDESHQQITNVSASTTPRQYQLFYIVQYSLIKANGKPIASSKSVSVSRQLTVNNDRILGSSSEELQINREMHRDAAMQIINRLSRK